MIDRLDYHSAYIFLSNDDLRLPLLQSENKETSPLFPHAQHPLPTFHTWTSTRARTRSRSHHVLHITRAVRPDHSTPICSPSTSLTSHLTSPTGRLLDRAMATTTTNTLHRKARHRPSITLTSRKPMSTIPDRYSAGLTDLHPSLRQLRLNHVIQRRDVEVHGRCETGVIKPSIKLVCSFVAAGYQREFERLLWGFDVHQRIALVCESGQAGWGGRGFAEGG